MSMAKLTSSPSPKKMPPLPVSTAVCTASADCCTPDVSSACTPAERETQRNEVTLHPSLVTIVGHSMAVPPCERRSKDVVKRTLGVHHGRGAGPRALTCCTVPQPLQKPWRRPCQSKVQDG